MLTDFKSHRVMPVAARQRRLRKICIEASAWMLVTLSLTACSLYRDPEKIESVKGPNGKNVAELLTYESRGTLSGNLRVILRGHDLNKDPEFSIHRIKAGKIGWIDDNVLLVVADKMQLAEFAMVNYVGSNTGSDTNDNVLVIPCLRSHMDCSPLEAKTVGPILSVDFEPYSLDRHFSFWTESVEQGK